jgi:hypothetical protein
MPNIWEAIFGLFRAAISFILGMMPAWNPIDLTAISATIADKIGPVFGFVNWADQYMPAKLGISLVGLRIGLHIGAYAVNFVTWLLAKLHIAGGA